MSANTKIVVLRSKELIYTAVLVAIGIFVLLIVMSLFNGNDTSAPLSDSEQSEDQTTSYVPGIYTTSFTLGNNDIQLQITVDAHHINDISIINLSDAITTMYPLVEPTLSDLSSQIIDAQSIENITYPEETKYTSMILLQAMERALEKAKE